MPWKVKYEFAARPAQVARYLYENTRRIPFTHLRGLEEGVYAQPTGSERVWRLFCIRRGKHTVRTSDIVPCLHVKLSEHDRCTTMRGFWFVIPSYVVGTLVWFLFVYAMIAFELVPWYSLGTLFMFFVPILLYAVGAIPEIRHNKYIYQVLDECQAEMSRRRQPVKSKAGRARRKVERHHPNDAARMAAP